MGKFDGILILSDWDGTLCYGKEIPESNVEKIRYFCREGGLFTVCTGRFFSHIEHFKDKVTPNTYVACLNGAYILDPRTKEVVYEGVTGDEIHGVLYEFANERPDFTGFSIYTLGCDAPLQITPKEYLQMKGELDKRPLYKAMLLSRTEENAITCRDLVNSRGYKGLKSVRSWNTGLELMSPKSTKGDAALLIKRLTGARLLVCVGDYENDADMLKVADISYAPGNATDSIKKIAMKTVADVHTGTIAAVIDDIEKSLTKA